MQPHFSYVFSTAAARAAATRTFRLLCGALFLTACTSQPQAADTTMSSQTHWLMSCESSSECGDLSCECGFCTRACAAQDVCSSLGETAACVVIEDDVCGSSSVELCVPACTRDADCDSSSACVNGGCVLGATSTQSPASSGQDASAANGTSANSSTAGSPQANTPDAASDNSGSSSADAASSSAQQSDSSVSSDASQSQSQDTPTSTDGGPVVDSAPDNPSSTPPDAGASELGIRCTDYNYCFSSSDCPGDSPCTSITGCGYPICIPSAEACTGSCPDPSQCAILESDPLQIQCPGIVDGIIPCGDTTCTSAQRCCDHCTSACIAATSGANCPDDNNPERACSIAERTFECGDLVCSTVATEYCSITDGGPVGAELSYSCEALPTACVGAPSCECDTFDNCTVGPDGELRILTHAP